MRQRGVFSFFFSIFGTLFRSSTHTKSERTGDSNKCQVFLAALLCIRLRTDGKCCVGMCIGPAAVAFFSLVLCCRCFVVDDDDDPLTATSKLLCVWLERNNPKCMAPDWLTAGLSCLVGATWQETGSLNIWLLLLLPFFPTLISIHFYTQTREKMIGETGVNFHTILSFLSIYYSSHALFSRKSPSLLYNK